MNNTCFTIDFTPACTRPPMKWMHGLTNSTEQRRSSFGLNTTMTNRHKMMLHRRSILHRRLSVIRNNTLEKYKQHHLNRISAREQLDNQLTKAKVRRCVHLQQIALRNGESVQHAQNVAMAQQQSRQDRGVQLECELALAEYRRELVLNQFRKQNQESLAHVMQVVAEKKCQAEQFKQELESRMLSAEKVRQARLLARAAVNAVKVRNAKRIMHGHS